MKLIIGGALCTKITDITLLEPNRITTLKSHSHLRLMVSRKVILIFLKSFFLFDLFNRGYDHD